MPSRKRRSLQSLLIPGLFSVEAKSEPASAQFHTWGHSSTNPARCSPPPDFLQDEDPFANLTSPPKSPTADSQTPPKSPTAPNPSSPLASPTKTQIPQGPGRSFSSRPAYQKPAFPSRPSLPSLDSLARMNVIIPPRIRKGRVGATLPVEPWDLPPPPTPVSPTELGSTFLDLSLDDEEELEPISPEEQDADRSLDSDDFESRPSLTRTSSSSDHSLSCSSTSSASSSESLGEERVFDDSTNYLYPSTADILNPSADHHLFSFPSFPADTHSISEYPWEPHICSSTPHTSVLFSEIEDDDFAEPTPTFEPGTSAGTVRAAMSSWDTRPLRRTAMLQNIWTEEPADSTGWEQQRGRGGWTTSNGASDPQGSYGWTGDGNGNGLSGGAGGAGDDGRDNGRKPPSRPSYSHLSSSETSSDEEEEEEEESTNNDQSRAQNSSDDDVPLAKRIPTALKAQRTIRIKAREEREQRRRERAERAARGESPRDLRLVRAGTSHHASPKMPSSQANAIHAIQRQRAQTLGGGSHPFAFEDLNKRLQNIQTMSPQSRRNGLSDEKDRSIPHSIPSSSPPSEQPRTLRPMRSFHREGQRTVDVSTPPPAEASLSRSSTRAKSRKSEEASVPPLPPVDASSLQPEFERKPTKLVKSPERTRPSLESPHLPLPPIPGHISKNSFSQRRVFVGDMQRFYMVEISSTTTASDVIQMVDDQGGLKGWVGSGGWMVWEVAQDFGMERPVRGYELLSDVEASWNKDKTVNTFVVRLTPLESLLSRSAIPTSSPIAGGYVEWQVKRGKWSKRWLALREHNLYLAKRDNGKDETFLCSLSNFDFYKVKSLVKAPKPFVFAIKSTDNLSLFEDTADYLHLFSCNENDGANWMEKILLARSYVLHQERNVLFNPKTSTPATSAATSLSRAPTRKSTPSSRVASSKIQSPVPSSKPQPLVNLNPHDVFEPGSLLSK